MSRVIELLDQADQTLQALTEAGGLINPAVPAAALVADKLLHIIQVAVKAHEDVTGEPIDMSKLHEIEPLPEPSTEDGNEG